MKKIKYEELYDEYFKKLEIIKKLKEAIRRANIYISLNCTIENQIELSKILEIEE